VGAGYRQQSDVTCPLDCLGNFSLVLGAVPGNPAGNNLAALGNKIAQGAWILVINGYLLIGAETANFTALKRSFLSWPCRAL